MVVVWGPPMQSNKGLAVLCFVYSGQIIQTTDIPAVFPAVNCCPFSAGWSGVWALWKKKPSKEDRDQGKGRVCTNVFSVFKF